MQPLDNIIIVDFNEFGLPMCIGIEKQENDGPWLYCYDVHPLNEKGEAVMTERWDAPRQEWHSYRLYLSQDRPLIPEMKVFRIQDDIYWARSDMPIIQCEEPFTRLLELPDLSAFWEKATLHSE